MQTDEVAGIMDKCATQCIHPEAIETVLGHMPASDKLIQLADFYKMFADGTRIRILAALGEAELCVCDLSILLEMKQPAVSHQLRILRQTRIVSARRQGRVIYYSLTDDHIRKVLSVGLDHIGEPHANEGS
jgi:ArsR family transcriptional regulator